MNDFKNTIGFKTADYIRLNKRMKMICNYTDIIFKINKLPENNQNEIIKFVNQTHYKGMIQDLSKLLKKFNVQIKWYELKDLTHQRKV